MAREFPSMTYWAYQKGLVAFNAANNSHGNLVNALFIPGIH